MEFHFSLFLFFPLLFLYLLKPFFRAQKRLPPGPWKLPIVGNLFQLAGTQPHHALTNMARKHGPIIHLQLGENSTIVISSARLAREALTTQDLALSDRPSFQAGKILFYNCTDIGFSPYNSYWKQMRKVCTSEFLSAAKVKSFNSVREEEVSSFIKSIRLSSGSQLNISQKISKMQNVIICRSTVGNGLGSFDQEALLGIIAYVTSTTGGFDFVDLFPSFKLLHFLFGSTSELQKTHQKLDQILDNIIRDHRKNLETCPAAKEDLLDVLLRLMESGGLEFPITSSNIKAVILDFFTAGTDTVSTTILWAMVALMRNKRVMEKAQAELRQVLKGKKIVSESDIQDLSYLKLVIKETLRLHMPGPFLVPRQCRKQCEINGYIIPVKTQVIINAYAISRDPDHWNNPECFEPERFENNCFRFNGSNFEYIPFGAGRRICPGISLGIASVELTLAQLLYHFDWKLPNGMKPDDVDMTEVFGSAIKPKNDLFVVASPYSPTLI